MSKSVIPIRILMLEPEHQPVIKPLVLNEEFRVHARAPRIIPAHTHMRCINV